jgi:hypothetical protein
MNRSRKGHAVPKLESGSTSQLPKIVARSSQTILAMSIAAERGVRSLKTTQSRIGTSPAPQMATDKFDMVTQESSCRPTESRAWSDENRLKELLRQSELPRTRQELTESDTNCSKQSMRAESIWHSEKEAERPPSSSEQHETRSHGSGNRKDDHRDHRSKGGTPCSDRCLKSGQPENS